MQACGVGCFCGNPGASLSPATAAPTRAFGSWDVFLTPSKQPTAPSVSAPSKRPNGKRSGVAKTRKATRAPTQATTVSPSRQTNLESSPVSTRFPTLARSRVKTTAPSTIVQPAGKNGRSVSKGRDGSRAPTGSRQVRPSARALAHVHNEVYRSKRMNSAETVHTSQSSGSSSVHESDLIARSLGAKDIIVITYRVSTRAVGISTDDVIKNLRASVQTGSFDILLHAAAKDDGATGLAAAMSRQIMFSSSTGASNSPTSLSAGAIVGIVFSVLAGVCLLGGSIMYYLKNRVDPMGMRELLSNVEMGSIRSSGMTASSRGMTAEEPYTDYDDDEGAFHDESRHQREVVSALHGRDRGSDYPSLARSRDSIPDPQEQFDRRLINNL